jgi:membrane protease YdiL (CAAX protease family)
VRLGQRFGEAPGVRTLALGIAAAQVAFALTFQGPRTRFWQRMTLTGVSLGSYALVVSRPARRVQIGKGELVMGLASAETLYVTFQLGDRFARRFLPGGERQIREIYALRELGSRPEIAVRLLAVVAPAEELFWRGLVQAALMRRLGRWRGAAAGVASYAGVHAVTGNLTLVGAAGVAGTHWALLYALGVPLGALIVSHAAWDIWIFLLQPTE